MAVIEDEIDQFMQTSFNFHTDVNKLNYKSILDLAHLSYPGEKFFYIAQKN